MFIIDKESLKKSLESTFNIKSFENFHDILNEYLSLLSQYDDVDLVKNKFAKLFNEICDKFNQKDINNRHLLFSVEGGVGIGKSLVLESIRERLNPNIIFLDEPLSIWQSIYYQNDTCKAYDGLNLIELFYKFLLPNSIFPFYFQSVVIFTRWLILIFTSNKTNSNIFLSERSVFSDRIFFETNSKYFTDNQRIIYSTAIQQSIENFFNHSNICLIYFASLYNEPATCLQRIIIRNRPGEDKVCMEYLVQLINKTRDYFNNWLGPKLILETDSYFSEYKLAIEFFINYQVSAFVSGNLETEKFRLKIDN